MKGLIPISLIPIIIGIIAFISAIIFFPPFRNLVIKIANLFIVIIDVIFSSLSLTIDLFSTFQELRIIFLIFIIPLIISVVIKIIRGLR